jgi:SAM-dependent methyltransferase
VEVEPGARLPFPDATFALVTARHPVAPDWSEIHRVLKPGGTYLAQHVGPGSAFALIEEFRGPLGDEREARDPLSESSAARAVGLEVTRLLTASCRMEFHDIGAVVWTLRKCVWWVPEFSVDRYRETLLRLDSQMRDGTPFVATSTRHLIEARRPD